MLNLGLNSGRSYVEVREYYNKENNILIIFKWVDIASKISCILTIQLSPVQVYSSSLFFWTRPVAKEHTENDGKKAGHSFDQQLTVGYQPMGPFRTRGLQEKHQNPYKKCPGVQLPVLLVDHTSNCKCYWLKGRMSDWKVSMPLIGQLLPIFSHISLFILLEMME